MSHQENVTAALYEIRATGAVVQANGTRPRLESFTGSTAHEPCQAVTLAALLDEFPGREAAAFIVRSMLGVGIATRMVQRAVQGRAPEPVALCAADWEAPVVLPDSPVLADLALSEEGQAALAEVGVEMAAGQTQGSWTAVWADGAARSFVLAPASVPDFEYLAAAMEAVYWRAFAHGQNGSEAVNGFLAEWVDEVRDAIPA